jgi:hypothetical protein
LIVYWRIIRHRVPAGAARRVAGRARTARKAQGRAGFARRERTLAHEHRSGIRVLFDGRRSTNTMIPAGELRASIHAVHAAVSCFRPGDCSQRVVPRGLGSCDGAEPDKHGGLKKCVFLCPVPELRLAGRAALHLGYSFFSGPQVVGTLRCVSNGRASRSTAIR